MEFINSAISYLMANPLIGGAVALVLIIAVYKKPKLILGLAFLALLLIGIFSFISGLSSTGASQKQKMIQK